MKINVNRLLLAGVMPALLLAGCSRRNEGTVGTPANPLVVLLSPAHSPSGGSLEVIRKHIEKAAGISVAVRVAKSASDTVRELGSGAVDAAIVTIEEYLVAREEYGVRPELQVLRGGGMSEYKGVILARAAGGPAGVAQLSGKKIGFVGPYSVSGFTLPSIFLKKAGISFEPQFFSGHNENVANLRGGKIDAAATYARQASRYPELKILAVTGIVPNEPLVTRGRLSQEKRDAVVAAFLTLADTPQGKKALGGVADLTGFRPVTAEVYRPLHELIRSNGKSIYDLVPEGWEIRKLNQPYVQGL